jgi:hypothetical protein
MGKDSHSRAVRNHSSLAHANDTWFALFVQLENLEEPEEREKRVRVFDFISLVWRQTRMIAFPSRPQLP